MREISLVVKVKVGTIEEIGLGGFKQPWVSTSDPLNPSRTFELCCGAGLGSPLIEAWGADGERHVYAEADISDFAGSLFRVISGELDRPLAVSDDPHCDAAVPLGYGEPGPARCGGPAPFAVARGDASPQHGADACGDHLAKVVLETAGAEAGQVVVTLRRPAPPDGGVL